MLKNGRIKWHKHKNIDVYTFLFMGALTHNVYVVQ